MRLSVFELIEIESDSQRTIDLVDFEDLTWERADWAIHDLLRVLKPEGVVEFPLLDFAWIMERYRVGRGTDAVMSDLLRIRAAVWDQLTIARFMLERGFAKVWTGQVPELAQDYLFYLKAIKG